MINKFQQGGKQQDAIMQFVQGLAQVLQVKPEQVIQVAQQNPKALESAVQVYQQTQDMNQAAQAFTQFVQKAKQGAKLQYLKSLKHQCAEDEELYYYKKGGSVGCGCKKKEDGGEMKPKKDCGGGAVAKFKKMRQGGQSKVVNGSTKQLTIQGTAKAQEEFKKKQQEKERQKKIDEQSLKDYESGIHGNSDNPPDSKAMSQKYIKEQESKKVSSGIGYHTIMADKCGSKVVKKFKKHRKGGSLNGIPFMQQGTPKGGVQYKPDWYKSIQATQGVFDNNTGNYYEMKTKRSLNGDIFNRKIRTFYSQSPLVSDTTYEYFPVKGQSEIESTTSLYDHNRKNYEKLKEMFKKIVSIPVNRSPIDLQ